MYRFFSNIRFQLVMVHDAATDPKRILCCFRAIVLLLLASSVFLVISCRVRAGFLLFLVLFLVFVGRVLADESGV